MKVAMFSAGGYLWSVDDSLSHDHPAQVWEEAARWFDSEVQYLREPKPGKGTVVGVKEGVPSPGRRVVVKRYRPATWTVKLKDQFRISRAKRAFLIGRRLLEHGIPTARPIAAGSARGESLLVTEYLENAMSLELYRRDPRYRASQVPPLRSLARVMARVFEIGYVHTDIFTSNFFVVLPEKQITLIDLDGLRWRPWITRDSISRSIALFIKRVAMDARERCWFVAEFVRSSKSGWESRELLQRCEELLAGKLGQGR
jgi:tRNA A-37 threonylcarbamoyl transferase component Bud32